MKQEDAEILWPLIKAWAEGGTMEGLASNGEWIPSDNWDFTSSPDKYRIKPKLKLRPWKPEEMPLNAVFRHGNNGYPTQWVDQSEHGLRLAVMGRTDSVYTWQDLLDHWTHTIDYGKTWSPCGVEE
jgi:hypothetical protein